MKKKILIFSIIIVLMLVAITFATAVSTEKTTKKTSPLYNIRTNGAINRGKINEIKKSIKTRFIGERIFFIPILSRLQSRYNNLLPDQTTRPPYHICWRSMKMDACCSTTRNL